MITLTLTQVAIHFSPIILMESFIPRIQDGMRRIGLPYYRSEENRWILYSHDEREMVIITASSFVYQRFGGNASVEERAEELFLCLHDGAELSEGAVVARVGIRRLCAIEGFDWKPLLKDPYHGIQFPASLQADDLRQYHSLFSQGVSSVGSYGVGNLSVRMLQNGRGLVFPLDIVQLAPEEGQEGAFVTVLDIEHLLLTDEISSLGDMLKALGRGCDELLKQALSDEGAALWQTS